MADDHVSERAAPRSINAALGHYFSLEEADRSGAPAWFALPEIPTAAEISPISTNPSASTIHIRLPENQISSAWRDNLAYLSTHYRLLREDAIAPLRNAVDEVRAKPDMLEKDSIEHAGLYDLAYITGLTFTYQGIAAHVEFSTHRAEKRIRWNQSKRLISGGIIALTTTDDMFRSVCIVAVVAGRPLSNLQQDKPAIDIFFQDAVSIELDPAKEWFMVEARTAYFEAYRHTLRSLQKMATEPFPLSEHLVNIQRLVQPPTYVLSKPARDLSPMFASNAEELSKCNILTDWPIAPASTLDASQTAALRQILTKRVAIVQGPPGTGKTYVAVQAIKLLLNNMAPYDPPIIIAAQTNHALDQLLRHIASFEPNFIRIGSRVTDEEVVEPRTLHNIRRKNKVQPPPGCAQGRAKKERGQILTSLMQLCQPLLNNELPFSAQVLLEYDAISQEQYDLLEKGTSSRATSDRSTPIGSVPLWLKRFNYVRAKNPIIPKPVGEQYEDSDQEFEQLRETEAEQVRGVADDDYDTPHGETVAFLEPCTGRAEKKMPHDWPRRAAQIPDLWRIPEAQRGAVYAYLRDKTIQTMRDRFCKLASSYDKALRDLKLGHWEIDIGYLKKARVVGVTTTGLNKYRGLLSSLSPRIILIEEASETLEANIATACFSTTEHLILVGDHKQLRPQCACRELGEAPFYLAVSLFERLVNVGIEFSQLRLQRRMAPEIRALLAPIYDNLMDHPSVLNRPDVPGMGTQKSFFFTHQGFESNDDAMSKVNKKEANMIVGLVDYLVLNGTKIEHITVLTFYNGQRKLILKGLKDHHNLQGCRFNVNTVDSYQGEENEVIILSLVRNKRLEGDHQGIGFVSIANRICVALSRAKRGFYVFGNHYLLSKNSDLWEKVIDIFKAEPRHISKTLHLTCQNHKMAINIKSASEWDLLTGGGCTQACDEKLPCGHICSLKCHPFDHSRVNCTEQCARELPCGHECTEPCYAEQCVCLRGHKYAARHHSRSMSSELGAGDHLVDGFEIIIDDDDSRPGSPVAPKRPVPIVEHKKRFVNKPGANGEPVRLFLGVPAGVPPVVKLDHSPGVFEQTLINASDMPSQVRPTPTITTGTLHADGSRRFDQPLISIFDDEPLKEVSSNDSLALVKYAGNSYKPSTYKSSLRPNINPIKSAHQPNTKSNNLSSHPPSSTNTCRPANTNGIMPDNVKAWQDFANGGHKAADAALAERERERVEAKRRDERDKAGMRNGTLEGHPAVVKPPAVLIPLSPPLAPVGPLVPVSPIMASVSPAAAAPSARLVSVSPEKNGEGGNGRRVKREAVLKWREGNWVEVEVKGVEKSLLD